jgi:hypothetical protein
MAILPLIFTSARHPTRFSIKAISFGHSTVFCPNHGGNCILVAVGYTARPATVSAQLAQIAGRRRLKLTIVPSAKVEL